MVHYALVGRGVLVGDGGQEPMMSQRRPIKNAVVWLGLLAAVALFGLAACSSRPATALSIAESPSMNLGDEMNNLAASLLPQTENYTDPAGPLFTGEAVLEPQPAPDEIVVVSYNLRYGEAITETIQAFQETLPLPEVDIVMLQEMDEAGVATIAEALGFNYVYYPASVAEDGDNFGNAILARWPISEPAKLILPGLHPLTGQQRTATRAVVHLGGTDVGTAVRTDVGTAVGTAVLVYSTHIEVATTPIALRQGQFAAVTDDIPDDATHVIVGGDFNTVTGRGVKALVAQFGANDLDHATDGLGPTFTRFGLRPSATDHLFTRGFRTLDAGVLGDITASDHFPVWARLGAQLARP